VIEGSVLMRSWHRTGSWRLRTTAGYLVALAMALLLPAAVNAAPPEGRVYEQVTPPNKNGAVFGIESGENDVGPNITGLVARDGVRVETAANAAFGDDDPGSVIAFTPHLLERGTEGWRTRPLSPALADPQRPPTSFAGTLAGPWGFTPDLSRLLFSSEFKLDPRDVDDVASPGGLKPVDLYGLRPGTLDATVDFLSCPAAPEPDCADPTSVRLPIQGVNASSADGRVAVFETTEPFLGATGPQIYARVGDELRWTSKPLETVPPGATQVTGTPSLVTAASSNAGQPNTPGAVGAWTNAISEDSSRVFFASPSGTQDVISRVYVRVGDERTLEVSRLRGGDPTAQKVKFRGASTDGDRALLSTQQALLPAAGGSALETDPNALEDLYLWTYDEQGDPANDSPAALTRIAGLPQVGIGPSPDGQVALNVLGASDDMTRVYFTARTAMTPFEANLYLAELPSTDPRGGAVRWIAKVFVDTSAVATFSGCLNPSGAGASTWGTCARATPDGRYLGFESRMPLTPDDAEPGCAPTTSIPTECAADVFVYDADREALERASAGTGGHDNGAFDATLFGGATTTNAASKRALHVSNSGEVFFVTTEALVAEDTNERQDVYAFSGGTAELISSGQSGHNSLYVGASQDGRDVFFATAEGLVPEDTDGAVDFYDARVGGGFDRSQPPRCEPLTDNCQAPGSAPPGRPVAESRQPGGSDADAGARARITLARPSARALRRAARTGTIRVSVRTNAPGNVKVAARARLRRGGKARTRTIATGVKRAIEAGTVKVRLRLNRAARAQLRSRRTLAVTLRATLPGAFGHSRSVVLRLPRAKNSNAASRQARGDSA
jgi:hypothetical protein